MARGKTSDKPLADAAFKLYADDVTWLNAYAEETHLNRSELMRRFIAFERGLTGVEHLWINEGARDWSIERPDFLLKLLRAAKHLQQTDQHAFAKFINAPG
jgi:hypothetical protein